MKRLLVLTGDASGDVHGAAVIRRFQENRPEITIHAVGGAEIAATGVHLLSDQRHLGALGLGVFSAIPRHWWLLRQLQRHSAAWRPNAVLLIDYGIFNLRFAKIARRLGIPTFYYIPPQIWASRPWRIKTIQERIDRVFTIFPFEKPLYDAAGVPATFVGHPLLEQVAQIVPSESYAAFCTRLGLDPERMLVGLFPGSRMSEVTPLLPAMLQALPLIQARHPAPIQFVLARSSAIDPDRLSALMVPWQMQLQDVRLQVISHENHAILAHARAILAASGTVTLEAALYRTPAVITYKMPWLAYGFFRRFCTVAHIGLPNLLSSHPEGFLPELLMQEANPDRMAQAILPYLSDTVIWQTAQAEFSTIAMRLGQGSASRAVMQGILEQIEGPLPVCLSEPVPGPPISVG